MSFTLHIDSPASYGNPGGNPPRFSSGASNLSLLARIWLWLSQIWGRETYIEAAESVFCLGVDDTLNGHRFQGLHSAKGLNRQMRRLLARYTRLGLSLERIKAWVKARVKRQKFQTALLRYYNLAFFRSKARQASRICRHDMGQDELCKAPLTPD